jgi:DNA-binding response OmpR family regulator
MTRNADLRSTDPASGLAFSGGKEKKTVLVVDDEKDLVELISYNLRRNGYDVLTAGNGKEALETAQRAIPDLVLLDLMLPGMEGTEVTRRLKSDPRTAGIPIIMVTAKGEEPDVVLGLTIGADDYITKPFSPKILMARLSAVIRRREAHAQESSDPPALKAGPVTIDLSRHEVSVEGESIRLTLTEFKLLAALLAGRGRVLTRDQLMDKAMGLDIAVTDRAIDVHINSIRRKLGAANWVVHTVRGVGYRMQDNPDDQE